MIGKDYPPYYFLCEIFDCCPAAIFVYLLLWRERKDSKVFINKFDIIAGNYTQIPHFLEYLFLLKDADILDIKETPLQYEIKLHHNFSHREAAC